MIERITIKRKGIATNSDLSLPAGMERITIKKKGGSPAANAAILSPAAINERGRVASNGVVMWGNWSPRLLPNGLTVAEMEALREKHNTPTPNISRALEVKVLMKKGMRCGQIVSTLRSKYGERSIKADHAALASSPTSEI